MKGNGEGMNEREKGSMNEREGGENRESVCTLQPARIICSYFKNCIMGNFK